MSHLEIALLCFSILLVVMVALLIDYVVTLRHSIAATEVAAKAQATALRKRNGDLAASAIERDSLVRKLAKAEQDLAVACALRPLTIDVPRHPTIRYAPDAADQQ